MATVKSIAYGRTFNNGNFESSRIDFSLDIEPGDDAAECFEDLFQMVFDARKKELLLLKGE